MGGHQEESFSPLVGAEGAGATTGFSSGAASCGMGEDQCHHPTGGPGDHGPADGSLSYLQLLTEL